MRQYLLNIVRAVLGLTDDQDGNDPLFDAVEEYVTAPYGDGRQEAYDHLKATYEWYKEQE